MTNNVNSPKAFACYSKNKKIINKSSSGGIFYTLASQIIEKYKGVVYGCICDWDEVYHGRAESIEELLPMMGSKYVRSSLKNTFKECKDDLENGRYVLYSGTPCQVNALHFYLDRFGVNKDKLISVDLICHGTPKISYWKEYLKINFGDKKADVNFRYKKIGWENFYIKIGDYEAPFNEDPYMKAFLNNQILHESCFNCKAKGENRKADITIGDFCGIDSLVPRYKNKNGTSLIFVRNKHKFLSRLIKKRCKINEVPFLESFFTLNPPYYISVKKPTHNKPLNFSDLKIKTKTFVEYPEIVKHKSLEQIIKSFISSTFKKQSNIYKGNNKRAKTNKIGIITENGYYNYGNRLQNYALLTFLKNRGKKVINLLYKKNDYTFCYHFYVYVKKINEQYELPFKKEIRDVSMEYEGDNFYFSRTKRKQKQLSKFETIVVGSDQVWNAGYHSYKNDLEFSLGNFGILNNSFKLISYAPSICLTEFNEEQKEMFSVSLNKFDNVSVREYRSKKLLETIGIKSVVVLDPTFLIEKEQWDLAIFKYCKVSIPKCNYIFNYIFDNDSYVQKDSEQYDLVVDCLNKDNPYYNSNQFDFINLIKHSSVVVTNSFHALVFSILFQKKVVLVERAKCSEMEVRIKELLLLFDIELVYGQEYNFNNLDYSNLNNMIASSKSYLIDSL